MAGGGTGTISDRIDALTAVMHELGHALGLDHDSSANDVMYESLATGERHSPGLNHAADLLALTIYDYTHRNK